MIPAKVVAQSVLFTGGCDLAMLALSKSVTWKVPGAWYQRQVPYPPGKLVTPDIKMKLLHGLILLSRIWL